MFARWFPVAPVGLLAACLSLGGLTACKEPEPAASVANVQTPLPPYPAWADGMVGQTLTHVVNGRGVCNGVWDVVTSKHVASKPGAEAEGWGWDVAAKTPVQHVLFVNADNVIVGAGQGGRPRPDVAKALNESAALNTGWHGVIGATTGKILAVGVTAKSASCALGSYDLSATTSS